MGKALPNKLLLEQVIKKVEMLDNNKTSLILIRNPENQNRSKHIHMTDRPSYSRSGRKSRTKNIVNTQLINAC